MPAFKPFSILALLTVLLLSSAPGFSQQSPTPGHQEGEIDTLRSIKALIPGGGTAGWFETYDIYEPVEGLESATPESLKQYTQRQFGSRVDNLFEDMRAPQESALLAIEHCDGRLMSQAMGNLDFLIDRVKERLAHADYVLAAIKEQIRYLDQEENLYYAGDKSEPGYTEVDHSTVITGFDRDPRDSFLIALRYPDYWDDWVNSTVPWWRKEKFEQAKAQRRLFAQWQSEMRDVQRYLKNGLKIAQDNRKRLHTSFNAQACQACR